MTKQTTMRVIIVVLLLALASVVLVTCSTRGTTAPEVATPTAEGARNAADTVSSGAASSGAASSGAAASAANDTQADSASTGSIIPFVIDQAASEARFFINETLVGAPTEVKGVTNLISGTFEVDTADPAKTIVGTITIDARDLHTDRDMRNRSIRRLILESNKDEYRYITFTPTAVAGMPATVAPGASFTFQITGDLKIKDVSKPVTFDVNVKADSDSQISGLAKTTVKRSDFNLSIPSVPGVADVTDEVRLELAFTAKAE